MGNMSYCRFQNTLSDLQECRDHLDDDLGAEEKLARRRLLKLCKRIGEDYEGEIEELEAATIPVRTPRER